ncbi:porin [Sessilibacter corallicola]|uniref:Porin domain-containing protein n=1 Tax=Sessilibacter corallicola TaxID=2904075 RepID=A0ABQ0ACK9_9GAMM
MKIKIKKTCLALSCAAALPLIASANEPDISFYGSLRVIAEAADHENGDNFQDGLSRVGVNGNHDLGDGLSVFANYELKVDLAEGEIGSETSNDARQSYVGLKGDFGTVQFGRYWSTYYNAIASAPDQLLLNSAPVYYTLDPNFHIGKSAMYTSPSINGFQVSVLYSDEAEQGQLSSTYQVTDRLRVAVGFIEDDQNDAAGVSAYYKGNGYYLSGMYMDKDNTGKGFDIISGVSSGKSTYTLGVSSYKDQTDTNNSNNDFDAIILGYQYAIHPSVQAFVEAWSWDGVLYGVPDSKSARFGLKYDF